MRIKKAGILIIAAAITCTTPAVPAMAADTSESVQEIISDNEIDSLVSDPDKVVDIIMYVKNEAAKQDISDDQIRSLIQTAESTAGVSLSEEEENRIIKIVKQIKDSDIDEEQLRSAVTKAYDKLEEISADEEKRLEYEERQKAIRDHRHMLASGRREGLREGLREGKHEHAVEMARKMLEDKLPIEKIAEYSGLSPEDVHRLEEQ